MLIFGGGLPPAGLATLGGGPAALPAAVQKCDWNIVCATGQHMARRPRVRMDLACPQRREFPLFQRTAGNRVMWRWASGCYAPTSPYFVPNLTETSVVALASF